MPSSLEFPVSITDNVYCQKPLAHEIFEVRTVTEAARKRGIVSQMGIQLHSTQGYRMAVQMMHGGVIGKIKEVHIWENKGDAWLSGAKRPATSDPVPANLSWEDWIGVAPMRPYANGAYHPFNWRAHMDFGVGMMGDMGTHLFDVPFEALALTSPLSVIDTGNSRDDGIYANGQRVTYVFPGTKYSADSTIKIYWANGVFKPDASKIILPQGMERVPQHGTFYAGEKGSILLPHGGGPILLPCSLHKSYKRPKLKPRSHYHEWVDCCFDNSKPSANFDFAGPLTEMILLGVLAGRFTGKTLEWNTRKLKVSNLPEANKYISRPYRNGWETAALTPSKKTKSSSTAF